MDQKKKEPNSTAATPAADIQSAINKMAAGRSEESWMPQSWIRPARDILESATKREAQADADTGNSLKIVFGTSGEYPDGTKWERDATPEEEDEYRGYME